MKKGRNYQFQEGLKDRGQIVISVWFALIVILAATNSLIIFGLELTEDGENIFFLYF